MLVASSLLALAPTLALAASSHRAGRPDAHRRLLQQRQSSSSHELAQRDGGSDARFTYYITSVGLGSCGILHQDSELTVALNSAQYQAYGSDYPSPVCGKTITVQVGSTTAQATVQDECPTCPEGGLDLSPGLFKLFADESVGVLTGNWWYGSDSSSGSTTTTTSEAAAATTSTSEAAAWTPTSSSEAAWTSTTSSSEEAAWTPTSSSEAAATTTSSTDNWNVNAAVQQASSSSSSSDTWVAPTTSSSDTWTAPTTTSTADAWEAATTSSAADWQAAPSSTEQAWTSAAAATATVLYGSDLCPSPPQFVVLSNATVVYNGTVPLFLNETLAASANATLFNETSIYDAATDLCFNSTLYSIDLYASFSANSTSSWNTTLGGGENATLTASNNATFLGSNVTLSAWEGVYNFTTVADNETVSGLLEIIDMLTSARSSATSEYLLESIVEDVEEDEDDLPWCDDEE